MLVLFNPFVFPLGVIPAASRRMTQGSIFGRQDLQDLRVFMFLLPPQTQLTYVLTWLVVLQFGSLGNLSVWEETELNWTENTKFTNLSTDLDQSKL